NAFLQWRLDSTEVTPPAWSLVTEQTLRTLALTRQGNASVTNSEIHLRGMHDNPPGWQAALRALERTLLPGMRITNEVIVFDDSLSFGELCQQRFEATLRAGRQVRFQPSSDDLSPAAWPLLDALIEIAADCPGTRMIITGHSDADGREQQDTALGTRRAGAVVSYMTAHGISAARLHAVGADPLALAEAINTPAARARSRRIDFSLQLVE
ncbi:MAG: OmpA family protein, partial [Halioglobus sp.]|nr:OmpA family protein [Halioglobus sp.]